MTSRAIRTFKIMGAVKERYAESKLGDGAFAALLTDEFGFKVHRASVTQARKEFGMESNTDTGPTAAEMREAYALLAQAQTELMRNSMEGSIAQILGQKIKVFLEGDEDDTATETI